MRITFDFFYCIKNMLLSQNDASLYRFTWMSSSPEPHITAGANYTPLPLPITHSTDNLSDTYPVMQIYMSTGITGKIHGQDTLASIGTRGENIRLYPDTAASHVGFVTGVIDSC